MSQLDLLIRRYPVLGPLREKIQAAYELLLDAARNGKILVCGNGGSASDAEHVVGELMKEFNQKRPVDREFARRVQAMDENPQELIAGLQGAIPAVCLNSQTSLLTALSNDGDPSMVFAQQVYGYGRSGDVLLAFSTSGNSKNVWNAVRAARGRGVKSILISGAREGRISALAEVSLLLPETETYRVQELTLPVYHTLCLMLEETLFQQEQF